MQTSALTHCGCKNFAGQFRNKNYYQLHTHCIISQEFDQCFKLCSHHSNVSSTLSNEKGLLIRIQIDKPQQKSMSQAINKV